jgi:Protein of unknown function (DUF2844)
VNAPRGLLGKVWLAAGAASALLVGAVDARATLGADGASVAANEHNLGAVRQVAKVAAGERHDLQLPNGVQVHEYLSPSGAVYAVTWSGPRVPDLRELLGPYFAQLEGRRSNGAHNQMTLSGADLEVRSVGHGRSFSGRAWVPSLVPPGVDVDAALE